MKNIFLVGLLSFLFSSCCNYACDCFDECDRAIGFSFSTDSLTNGYKISEIDTIVVYKLPKGENRPLDSVALFLYPGQNNFSVASQNSEFCSAFMGFAISEWGPFRGTDFADFDYQIKVPKQKTFHVTNIVVEGDSEGNHCCSCYSNNKKLLELDGVAHDISGESVNQKIITLTK